MFIGGSRGGGGGGGGGGKEFPGGGGGSFSRAGRFCGTPDPTWPPPPHDKFLDPPLMLILTITSFAGRMLP